MAISVIKPGGWSTNQKLTSAQITSIDANVTNALDKRVGYTDSLKSTVTIDDGYINVTGSGNRITLSTNAKLNANGYGSAIEASAVGSRIKTSGGGLFEIGGPDGYFPIFTTPRTKSIIINNSNITNISFITYLTATFEDGLKPLTLPDWIVAPTTFSHGIYSRAFAAKLIYNVPIINGAVLSSIIVNYKITTSHLPANKLTFYVDLIPFNSPTSVYTMLMTGSIEAPGINAAAYYASTQITIPIIDMTPIIGTNRLDDSLYEIRLGIVEESGVGAIAGNIIYNAKINYINIIDTRI